MYAKCKDGSEAFYKLLENPSLRLFKMWKTEPIFVGGFVRAPPKTRTNQ